MSDEESSEEENTEEEDENEEVEEEEVVEDAEEKVSGEEEEGEESGRDSKTDVDSQKVESELTPPEPEVENILTKEEAGMCLTLLGKTGNAIEYAYLKIEAINRDLTDITIIPSFKYVEFVDVSGNRLRNKALHCLVRMKLLAWLKAERNLINSLDLPVMPFLQVLSLAKNEITSTSGIKQPMLESLDLNYNRIKMVEGLDSSILEKLRNLELRGNSLVTTSGVSCPTLQSLYLAENSITKLEGLEVLMNLQILHLRDNKLKKLDGFSNKMEKLNYINIRKNQVRVISELKKLNVLPSLETVVVLENPFTLEAEEEYRVEVLVRLPKLKRINKDPVQQEETEEADEMRADYETQDEEEDKDDEDEEEEEIEAKGEGESDREEESASEGDDED